MPNGNNKTKKVKRVGFSNNRPLFFGTNSKNKNVNNNLTKSLTQSRKGNKASPVRRNLASVRLNQKEAKLLANLSAASADTEQILGHIQKLQMYLLTQSDPSFADFPPIQLDATQRRLFQSLYSMNSRVDKMEGILDKIKTRILSRYE